MLSINKNVNFMDYNKLLGSYMLTLTMATFNYMGNPVPRLN